MTARQVMAFAALALLAALVQGSVVARLPWPGAGAPHLAALAVVAIALAAGAYAGAVLGFGTGLLLDLVPPADHALGQWAFVLCLLGGLAGMLARDARASLPLGVLVGGVVAVLATPSFAALGEMLSDPRADLVGAGVHAPAAAMWTMLLAAVIVPAARRACPSRESAVVTSI